MTAQTVPNTGLIVTTDVGDPTNIHPTDKKTVGDRLAQWALGTTYGKKDVVPTGPERATRKVSLFSKTTSPETSMKTP